MNIHGSNMIKMLKLVIHSHFTRCNDLNDSDTEKLLSSLKYVARLQHVLVTVVPRSSLELLVYTN